MYDRYMFVLNYALSSVVILMIALVTVFCYVHLTTLLGRNRRARHVFQLTRLNRFSFDIFPILLFQKKNML